MDQPDSSSTTPALDIETLGDAARAIATLAWVNGVTAAPEPIDEFANAVSRLSDAAVELDHFERLLLGLARKGIVDDQERFALHAAYLHQKTR